MAGGFARTAEKIGKGIDVAGRKVANTSNVVGNAIGAVQPYLNGIPIVESLATLGRDTAKGVQMAGKAVHKGGQILEKESRLGEKAIKDVSFV